MSARLPTKTLYHKNFIRIAVAQTRIEAGDTTPAPVAARDFGGTPAPTRPHGTLFPGPNLLIFLVSVCSNTLQRWDELSILGRECSRAQLFEPGVGTL